MSSTKFSAVRRGAALSVSALLAPTVTQLPDPLSSASGSLRLKWCSRHSLALRSVVRLTACSDSAPKVRPSTSSAATSTSSAGNPFDVMP